MWGGIMLEGRVHSGFFSDICDTQKNSDYKTIAELEEENKVLANACDELRRVIAYLRKQLAGYHVP